MSIQDTHNRILSLCKPVLIKKNLLRNVSYQLLRLAMPTLLYLFEEFSHRAKIDVLAGN